MKLKSLAALFFRIVGACGIIESLLGLEFHTATVGSVIVNIGTVIVGCALIYFSKAVARLFCKGLDDDAA
jgi:hypothetical protein